MAVDSVYEEMLSKVRELIEKLRKVWADMVNGVNHVLDSMPGFLGAAIKQASDWCAEKVVEVFTVITDLLAKEGSASALRTVAESWNEQVGHRASTQAGLLVKEQLDTDNDWTGPAADRYSEAVTSQNRALAQIKAITENLQNTLNEIASAMTSFWSAVGVAVGGYMILMAACIGGIASGVGTIPGLAGVTGFSVALLTTLNTCSHNFANTLEEKKTKIDQMSTMDSQFTNGTWPSAVTDQMSDASVKDGDKSDWTVK
jgi:uncharacterized protein YukE